MFCRIALRHCKGELSSLYLLLIKLYCPEIIISIFLSNGLQALLHEIILFYIFKGCELGGTFKRYRELFSFEPSGILWNSSCKRAIFQWEI